MQINGTSPAGAGPLGGTDKASLRQAAQQFEAIFLRQMIGAMRSASLAEGITDTSASDQFRDMADARTADAMAGTHALGIAAMLLRQFEGSATPQDKSA
ncbi:MAG: rod-binding protein [Sphingobium sp.]